MNVNDVNMFWFASGGSPRDNSLGTAIAADVEEIPADDSEGNF